LFQKPELCRQSSLERLSRVRFSPQMLTNDAVKPLTPQEVEAAVHRYWEVSSGKKSAAQETFYSEIASVFTSSSRRLEPARLVLLRRRREYLESASIMTVNIGRIEIELLDPATGVAAYTIGLHVEHVAKPGALGEKDLQEHIDHARVTHVFQRADDGKLKIVHEHISAPQE
jgi:hypothetical protein